MYLNHQWGEREHCGWSVVVAVPSRRVVDTTRDATGSLKQRIKYSEMKTVEGSSVVDELAR